MMTLAGARRSGTGSTLSDVQRPQPGQVWRFRVGRLRARPLVARRAKRPPTMPYPPQRTRRSAGLASAADGQPWLGLARAIPRHGPGEPATLGCGRCTGCRSQRGATSCVEVIRRYLPLVQQVVQRISRRLPASVMRDDLLAAGLCGLADSLRRNGGSQGGSFEAYARIRIQGAVLDELRAQDWLPRRLRAASTGNAEVEAPLPMAFLSLDDLQGVEELVGLPPANENPGDEAEARSERAALVRAIEQLPERERHIVGMHYFQGLKFKDIGESFGVSEPRISQLHARALGRLRLLLLHPAA